MVTQRVKWHGNHKTDGDESVHYFSCDGTDYALVFEDYQGLGGKDAFIREWVLGSHQAYEIIEPRSQTSAAPSYDGFRLPAPSRYCENVTGSFTLIRLASV